jgi:hypothetical protein
MHLQPVSPSYLFGDCRIAQGPDGSLSLITPDGQQHDEIAVFRGFPLSAPDGPVSFIGADGQELLWVSSLEQTPDGLRQLLQERLAADEFLPRIEAIESVSRAEPGTWQVRTDRGRQQFELAAADGVAWHPDGGVTITDRDGICYVIPAVRLLDRRSRRLLERHG